LQHQDRDEVSPHLGKPPQPDETFVLAGHGMLPLALRNGLMGRLTRPGEAVLPHTGRDNRVG
jgi:hypothetical protein